MGGDRFLILALCTSLLLIISGVQAHSFYAKANKLVYTPSDNLTVTGNITDYVNAINMTSVISNTTPVLAYNMSSNSSGSNLFVLSQPLSGIPEGIYTVNVSDGSSIIPVSFEVVSQIIYMEAHLINAQDVISISTGTAVDTPNAMGGNFTELINLSISKTLRYGNGTVSGKEYHFVLVDQNYNQTYDTLYADDDIRFELYNDSEDSGANSSMERILKKGQKFGDYMVGEIEFSTGNSLILGKPRGSSIFSPASSVNFVVMAKDSNRNFAPNINVQVRLLNSSKGVLASFTNTTESTGFFISSFTAPSEAGTYAIDLNSSKGTEFFTVESFKLAGKVTDLSDNPAPSFAPNSIVRIYANSRDTGGNMVNMTSVSLKITYPNGTSLSAGMIQSETGVYYYDFSPGSLTGSYGVKITGTYGGSSQEFITGFSVESISLQLMAMNMDFIDQAEGPGAQVNAFAPQSNVTLMVFLSNISAGGIMAKGPEGMGLIDIDNASTGIDECESTVSFVEFSDDMGIRLDIPSHYSVNVSRAIGMSGATPEEGPPEEVMRQCVIIFAAPNRTGTYKAVAEVNHNGEKKRSGASFSVQRLYAEGASVDSKGDDYWFFAPNTTMKIKLKIKDLATRQDLPSENITSAKIIEIYKEFPDYQDVFTSQFRQQANESVQNGTLVFNAPNSEGFFSLRFKFKAFVNGTEETGTGSAFFQLKKYMVWAVPQCQQSSGPCISGIGKNITLSVNVVDIDQGSMMSQMGKGTSTLSCTNCEGLVVDVTSLRNDQLMKEMVKDVDYSVVKGVVANATANLTIVPLSTKMQSGWYGMDLLVTDPMNSNNTYFGWGGFEARNFYVEMLKVESNGTDLFASWDMPAVLEKGKSVTFSVIARDPSNGDMLQLSSISLESVRWMVGWPPVEIPISTLTVSVSAAPVYTEWTIQPVNTTVINISGLDREGDFQANIKVSTSKGSDIGSYFFDLSTFSIESSYRGMDEWKPMFSSGENLTVNFTGKNFDKSAHNLSQEGTKLKSLFNEKTGSPIKLISNNSCSENLCIITTNLSSLQPGWYFAEYSVNDTQGYEKREEVRFMVQNLMVGIPSIEQADLWQSDTGSKEIDVSNDRDRCDNRLMFMGWVEGSWNSQDFCIRASGEWMQGTCQGDPGETDITVWSNGSMLNISGTNYTIGENFSSGGKNWTIVSIGSPNNDSFQINNSDGICGEWWSEGQNGGYIMAPPGSYTTFYHGFTSSLVSQGMMEFGPLSNNENRSLYFYHNTTHVWISNGSSNMTLLSGAKTIGDVFTDSYGGTWKVNSISKSKITIVGQNVLAQTGAYINMSLSKSGVVKLGRVEEQWLGGWDKNSGQNRGLDLDGDGYKNSTCYIAISDSQAAGIYDTFYFFNQSGNSDFSLSISVEDTNVSNKIFGLNDTVILLSIDPRANRVRFYSSKIGDWAELGDFRMDGNVSIPVIVRNPNGSSVSANISIPNIRVKGTDVNRIFSLGSSVPNATITGAGEIRITNISQYGLGPGEYVFEIRAEQDGSEEMLEEWKWPRANPRTFLVEGYMGQAGYISGFVPLQITRYDWENYGEPAWIYTINWTDTGKYFRAVLDFASGGNKITENSAPVNLSQCNFVVPDNSGEDNSNATLMSNSLDNPQHYYYITGANASRVWVKTGDCNFSGSTEEYTVNDTINVTRNGKKYMMNVLDADNNTESVVIGIMNSFFPDNVSALRTEMWGPPGNETSSPRWAIMGINISGTDYNALIANESSIDYPMCSVWNIQECAKKVWFSTSPNISGGVAAYVGENFTDQLYLAKVGPGPWEGISIANFSSLGALPRPAVDVRVKDNTTSYYTVISEAMLNMDLDMDSSKISTFYAITFDDMDDGQQNLNSIITDDDLNITEEWWSSSNTNQSVLYRKDFYGNETGVIGEKRSSLPSSIWSGNIRFGEYMEGIIWEYQPEWKIEKYNGTDMLLLKDEWEINGTRNITILVRAYHFNQSAIQGAALNITAVRGNIPGFGFTKLTEGADYSVESVIGTTNQDGFGILRIVPNANLMGEYIVDIQTAYGGNTETVNKWFKVM